MNTNFKGKKKRTILLFFKMALHQRKALINIDHQYMNIITNKEQIDA